MRFRLARLACKLILYKRSRKRRVKEGRDFWRQRLNALWAGVIVVEDFEYETVRPASNKGSKKLLGPPEGGSRRSSAHASNEPGKTSSPLEKRSHQGEGTSTFQGSG